MTSASPNYKFGFKLLQVEETWDVDNGICGRGLSEREKVQELYQGVRQVKAF